MSSHNPLVAEVFVTTEVSAEEEQAIVGAFRDLDVAARTRMVPTRRGLEQLHWLVLATLPLHAFLSGLGSAAAQDVAQGLKRVVSRVVGAKRVTAPPAQVLVLQDAVTQLQIVLEADLPTEAYRALVALDLSAFGQGPVHYDRQGGRWRSELDEWQQRQAKDSGLA
ncbi:MAG TPA: hypothetical protein VJT72_07710 [Pseudonocardiaceae bacterium]|nr:hypothetical protein [Pseudonocardiaceae bacterium]